MKLRPMRLHELDGRVIEYMLDREGQMYAKLRAQLPVIRTQFRYVNGPGYFTSFGVSDVQPVTGRPSAVIMDVDGRSPEVASEVGFILYVRDGLIDVLEGHAYAGEDWPKREEEIELFSEFFTRHHDGGIPYAPLA